MLPRCRSTTGWLGGLRRRCEMDERIAEALEKIAQSLATMAHCRHPRDKNMEADLIELRRVVLEHIANGPHVGGPCAAECFPTKPEGE